MRHAQRIAYNSIAPLIVVTLLGLGNAKKYQANIQRTFTTGGNA